MTKPVKYEKWLYTRRDMKEREKEREGIRRKKKELMMGWNEKNKNSPNAYTAW
jgi:hypothetical protein